jgi:hypothetical protein
MGRNRMGLLVLALLQTPIPAEPGPTTGARPMNLDNYVDVPTRLKLALEKWPDLRVQELDHEIIEVDGKPFLVCRVTVWRSVDDPRPAVGSAWEPLPGKTPYTKDSEWMVGFTSALGRALGYMGIGITSSIASANEVAARQDNKPTTMSPRSAAEGPSDAQMRMLKALGSTARPATKREASQLIDELKASAMTEEDPF